MNLISLVVILWVILHDFRCFWEVEVAARGSESASPASVERILQQFVGVLFFPPLLAAVPHQLGLWKIELSRTQEPQKCSIIVFLGDVGALVLELLLKRVEGIFLRVRKVTNVACERISRLSWGHRQSEKGGWWCKW